VSSATSRGGAIAVIAQEAARYSQFAADLTGLDLPPDWKVLWRFGWDLADAHNALIAQALAEGKEYVWFMGDDHAFSPNLLRKLLARDLDLVVPLCLMRNAPYRPVNWVAAPTVEDPDAVRRLDVAEYPDGGLVEVAASGAAGLLVKRRVFEAIEAPWFEAGTANTNRVGEDVNFCRKARAAGFEIFCDLDAVIGHLSTTAVWPVRESDGWTFAFSMMGGFKITLPPGFQAYADEVGR
jgi:hypothetical protein